MSDFLNDYKAYYAARAKRFLGDPDYPLSANAEADLNNAMQTCAELIEFKDKLGNLNDLCAVAQTKDKYKIRLKHYIGIKENVRALGPERIIQKADQYNNVMDLITMVTTEENINSVEINMDDISPLIDKWFMIERIEEYDRAEIPDKWKEKHKKYADDEKQAIRDSVNNFENEMGKWEKGWKFNPELVAEERHRRKLPYPDDEIEKRLQQLNKIINR